MFQALRQWLDARKARGEAERRLKMIAVRTKLFGNVVEAPSATGKYEIVKTELNEAIELKKKARASAQRILDIAKDPERK